MARHGRLRSPNVFLFCFSVPRLSGYVLLGEYFFPFNISVFFGGAVLSLKPYGLFFPLPLIPQMITSLLLYDPVPL